MGELLLMGELLRSLRAGSGSRLFVHCVTSIDYLAELWAPKTHAERYTERALLWAEAGDIVCLSDEVDPGDTSIWRER